MYLKKLISYKCHCFLFKIDKRLFLHFVLVTLLILTLISYYSEDSWKPQIFKVSEGFHHPKGFYDKKPTFSWCFPVENSIHSQSGHPIFSAYGILLLPYKTEIWNSKKTSTNKFSSECTDAATVMLWELYLRIGVVEILKDNSDMMKKLISYHETNTEKSMPNAFSFCDWPLPYSYLDDGIGKRHGDTPKEIDDRANYRRSLALTLIAENV